MVGGSAGAVVIQGTQGASCARQWGKGLAAEVCGGFAVVRQGVLWMDGWVGALKGHVEAIDGEPCARVISVGDPAAASLWKRTNKIPRRIPINENTCLQFCEYEFEVWKWSTIITINRQPVKE